ncbi:MAG: PDZ domain-containing protein [Actinomycetota bacterium]|nr:PDZ domain-containing protein [Actinomycetota bacterium]
MDDGGTIPSATAPDDMPLAAPPIDTVPTPPPTDGPPPRRRWRSLVASALFLGLVGIAFAGRSVTVPYVELRPGPVLDLADDLTFEGADGSADVTTTDVDGTFAGLTVAVHQIDLWDYVGHQLGLDDDELVARDQLYPDGIDSDEYRQAQLEAFDEATLIAAAVAEDALGMETTVEGDGASVDAIVDGSPAAEVLEVGDVIVAVDDTPIELATDLIAAIGADDEPRPISLTVLRDGTEQTLDVTLGEVAGLDGPGLGVGVTTSGQDIDLPITVTLEEDGVGGPSAGLLTALTIYDLLSDDDVAAGRLIAGTGTLDLDGRVGTIGGIVEKAQAAEAAGADVFIAPAAQAGDVEGVLSDDVTVLAVSTFDEALAALTAAA